MDFLSRGLWALSRCAPTQRLTKLPIKRIAERSAARRGRQLSLEQLESRHLLALTHLYTFNDGLANDWVGNSHGTLFNGAVVTAGKLTLANTGVTSGQTTVVQYMKLPANVLPNAGSATVAVWFTASASANWSRVFDVGDQTGANGNSYLFYTPQTSFDDSRATLHPAASTERVATGATTDDGVEHMAAVVVDTTAGLLRLYIDGAETGTAPLTGATPGSVNDTLAYLGRSLFNADPGFTGSINELRIYDDARSAESIAGDALAGPSTLTKSPQVRQVEYLNRGVVAIRRTTTQAYIGWRLLGTDPSNIAFNLYRSANGGAAVKLNASPLVTTTDFVDSTVNFAQTNKYFVRPVIGGTELAASESFTLAANTAVGLYLNVPLQVPAGRTVQMPVGVAGDPGSHDYVFTANDASVGDVDGDGQYEIILKWDPYNPDDIDDPDLTPPRTGEGSSQDNSRAGFTGNVLIDAYRLDGTLLWRIDLGKNIRAGAHYTQFMVYDFDGDGKAEVAMKTAPGTIDGLGNPVLMGSDSATADYRNSAGYILSGPEYLTVFNGKTGAAMSTIAFASARGSASQWGDTYGNRLDRYTSGIAYLDGVHPSLISGRGYYGPQGSGGQARNEVTAYDFRNGQLTVRWQFKAGLNINSNINSNYIGQGAHSLLVADVDADGKDEVIYGAAAIDDTGLGLYSTGLGHGDALHISDMDPSRPGLEVFMAHESPGSYGAAGGEFRDARTGQLIFGIAATNDVGRGVAFDIDPNYPGYEMWATTNDPAGAARMVYNASGQALYRTDASTTNTSSDDVSFNFGVWWDADPLRELLDGTEIKKWNYTTRSASRVDLDPTTSGTQTAPNASSNNSTKSTPALSADIFGDWREEVIWRRSDNTALEIFTTTIAATSRLTTLMHDTQYRSSIAAQNSAYNQPPHPSFFLGAGMTTPPPPQIYTLGAAARIEGDFNGDQRVDPLDLAIWKANYGKTSLVPGLVGDANGDLQVDNLDFLAWQQNMGAAPTLAEPAGAASVVVDETETVDAAFAQLAGAGVPGTLVAGSVSAKAQASGTRFSATPLAVHATSSNACVTSLDAAHADSQHARRRRSGNSESKASRGADAPSDSSALPTCLAPALGGVKIFS